MHVNKTELCSTTSSFHLLLPQRPFKINNKNTTEKKTISNDPPSLVDYRKAIPYA